jgi:hypothetical protein
MLKSSHIVLTNRLFEILAPRVQLLQILIDKLSMLKVQSIDGRETQAFLKVLLKIK